MSLLFFSTSETQNRADMPVDLVLLDNAEFSIIKDPKFRMVNGKITNGLPGKQYRTLGDTILIELKFNKNKTGITNSFKNKIIKDIEKLDKIIRYNSEKKMKGITITFNKTDIYCHEFEEEVLNLNRENIKVIYKTSGLEM